MEQCDFARPASTPGDGRSTLVMKGSAAVFSDELSLRPTWPVECYQTHTPPYGEPASPLTDSFTVDKVAPDNNLS